MNNAQEDTNQMLFYIVAIIILAFMIYTWFKPPSNAYLRQPNYHIYHTTNPINKEKIESFSKNEPEKINTESMVIGGHNSAHSSLIIASPYNSPKNLKQVDEINIFLPSQQFLYQKMMYPFILQQRKNEYYYA